MLLTSWLESFRRRSRMVKRRGRRSKTPVMLAIEHLEDRTLLAGAGVDDGEVVTVTEQLAADSRIKQEQPDVNYGTSSSLKLDGSPDEASLIRFDVSAIPSGSTIQSVTLTFNVVNASDDTFEIYELLRPWSESEVTFNEASDGVAWDVAGAQGAGDRGSTVLGTMTAESEGLASFELNSAGVAVVQSWLDNPETNYGLMLLDYTGANDKLQFSSSDESNASERPTVTITYSSGSSAPQNEAPIVDAGADQTILLDQTLNVDGTVTDDGLPGSLSTAWSVISGPGTVSFDNASAIDTSATFTAAGTYVLQLLADDGELSTTDEITVTVEAPPVNEAPTVDAGDSAAILITDAVQLDGTVVDDGLSGPVSTAWSVISGPGTVSFDDASAIDTTATFSAPGDYILELTADDGEFVTSDLVTITVDGLPVNESPIVDAGEDATILITDSANLDGTADDDGLPGPISTTWSVVSGPGTVIFGDATAVDTTAVFSAAGTYVLALTAGDGALSASDVVVIEVEAEEADVSNPTTGTVEFQDGVSQDGSYAGTADTMIKDSRPDRNYATHDELEIDGSPDKAALLRWDVSSITPGSSVVSASITLNVTNVTDDTYELYGALRSWVENEVTWLEFAEGQPWTQAGAMGAGDHSADVIGTVTAPSTGLVTIELNAAGVALVQSWIDNPELNYGILVHDYSNSSSNGMDFASREASNPSNRPKLSIALAAEEPPEPVAQIDLAEIADQSMSHTQDALDIDLEVTDAAGQVSYSVELVSTDPTSPIEPGDVVVGINGQTLSINPAAGFAGSFIVVVTADDGTSSDSESFTVSVTNNAPELSQILDQLISQSDLLPIIDPVFAPEMTLEEVEAWIEANDTSFDIELFASDADGDTLTFSIVLSNLEAGGPLASQDATVNLDGSMLQIDPHVSFAGQFEVSVTVTDGIDSDVETFLVTVTNDPQPFQFDDANRWGETATDGPGLVQGDATIITWSIVPDGTNVQSLFGGLVPSDLIAFLDGIYGAAPGPVQGKNWFPIIEDAVNRWAEVSGITYVFEPNDDGIDMTSANSGLVGVRGDTRIGGTFIDGDSGILAFNFFPDFGDMVIDTADDFYTDLSNNSLGTRNVVSHELGHGIGLNHVLPTDETKLMEPFVSFAYDGPQFDDILAANRGYGDKNEAEGGNDTFDTATRLTTLEGDEIVTIGEDAVDVPVDPDDVDFVSIDDDSDVDFYSFSITGTEDVDINLVPLGPTYEEGPQFGGDVADFDSAAQSDLTVELIDRDGLTVLATANAGGLGEAESIVDFRLTVAGEYFVRVSGADDAAQMYQLSVNVGAGTVPVEPDVEGDIVEGAVPRVSLALSGSPMNENGGVATVTAILDQATDATVVVDFGFGGPAIEGTDYIISANTLVIPAGQLTGTITLTAVDDIIPEGDELVTVSITQVINGIEDGIQQVTATIVDNDSGVLMSVEGSPFSENGGIATVVATLTQPEDQDVTITLGFQGEAVQGLDYTVSSNTIVIAAGDTTGSITLTGVDDTFFEPTEVIEIVVLDVVNSVVVPGNQQVTALIEDNEIRGGGAFPQITLSLTGSPFSEAGGSATVTATSSNFASASILVQLSFSGTAFIGRDYTPSSSFILIPVNQFSGSITLDGLDDLFIEADETIVVDIVGLSFGVEKDGFQQVTAVITSDDTEPPNIVRISDAEIVEGDPVVALAPAVSTGVGVLPQAAAAADLNGDDFIDLVVVSPEADSLTVLLNDGAGGYPAALSDTIFVGDRPTDVTIADFDLDGDLDLAVLSSNTSGSNVNGNNDVFLLYGNGDGTFETPGTNDVFEVGVGPISIVSADLDRLTAMGPDLIVVNETSGNVSVLLNQTGRVFAAPVNVAIGGAPVDIVTGDFDSDNFTDVAVVRRGNDSVSVLLNDGAGVLTVSNNYTIGPGDGTDLLSAITAADFDSDGDLDLAVSEEGSSTVTVLINDGTGLFFEPPDPDNPGVQIVNDIEVDGVDSPTHIAAGDIDGDRVLDLIVSSGATNAVLVLSGVGNGFFRAPQSFDTGSLPVGVLAIDVDNDGDLDVVSVNQGLSAVDEEGSSISVLENDLTRDRIVFFVTVDRQNSLPVTVDFTTQFLGSAIADLDFIPTSGTLAFGPTDTVMTIEVEIVADRLDEPDEIFGVFLSNATNAEIIDANNPSMPGATGTGTIIDDDDPEVTLSVALTVPDPNDPNPDPEMVTIPEMNGSARVTASLSAATNEDVTVFLSFDGTATFIGDGTGDYTRQGTTIVIPAGFLSGSILVNAVDDQEDEGDETIDIEIINVINGVEMEDQLVNIVIADDDRLNLISIDDVAILEGDSGIDLSLAPAVNYDIGTAGTIPTDVVTGDLNDDGFLDLVTANITDGTISILFNDGDGTFGSAVNIPVGSIPMDQPTAVAVGDFNQDGLLDIATSNPVLGTISILLNDLGTPGTFTSIPDFPITFGATTFLHAVDVNGDLALDLVVGSSATDQLGVLLNRADGTGTFDDATSVIGVGTGLQDLTDIAVGDLDDDGDLDFAVLVAFDDGTTFDFDAIFVRNNGNGTLAATAPLTVLRGAKAITIGDFNRDGSNDIVTVGFTSGVALGSILRNTGGGTFATPAPVFGAGSLDMAEVEAVDLNGDGAPDLALTNIDDGLVTVLLNDNNTDPTSISFTVATDVIAVGTDPSELVAGDFDNDFRPDLAVANTGSRNVSVLINELDLNVALFTVTMSLEEDERVTVDFRTLPGTAESDVDFVRTSGTVEFLPGETTKTIPVTIIGDLEDEDNQRFIVELFNVVSTNDVRLADPGFFGTGIIVDDDGDDNTAPQVLLIVDGSPFAEDGGVATVTVRLSDPTSVGTDVLLAFNGDATFGVDYFVDGLTELLPVPKVSLAPAQLEAVLTITGLDDLMTEGTESLVISNVGAPPNGIPAAPVVLAILDDESVFPSVSLSVQGSPFEENRGEATVTATLSSISLFDVMVDLSFAGTATFGADYTASNSSIFIPAGESFGFITLIGNDDITDESTETIDIEIIDVTNATIAGGSQMETAEIIDDDGPPDVTLSIDPIVFSEAGGQTAVTATLSRAVTSTVTVDLGFSGSAAFGVDYSASAASITIDPGDLSGSILLTGLDDPDEEGTETVDVEITSVDNGVIAGGAQMVSADVADDESPPMVTLSLSGSSFSENGGTAVVTANLSHLFDEDVTVVLDFSGTADLGDDYSASLTTVVIAAGDLSGSTTLTGLDDDDEEGPETVDVEIVGVTNGSIAGGSQTVSTVIIDDDGPPPPPQFTINQNPRLQLGNAPLDGFSGSETDQVEILWQTMTIGPGDQDSFRVEYRRVGDIGWTNSLPVTSIVTGVDTRIVHSAVIAGLDYDTDYEYRVRHFRGSEVIDAFQAIFHTRLDAGDVSSFSFVAYGDSADARNLATLANFRAVQNQINQTDAAFALLLGDIAYNDGTHDELDGRFDPTISPEAAEWIATHVDYAALGNHDIGAAGGQPTRDSYSSPIPVGGVTAPFSAPLGEPPEHNYSFDYGDVHFVTFDSNSRFDGVQNQFEENERLDAQLDWVVADLAASDAQWKVVFAHHHIGGGSDHNDESPSDYYFQQVVERLNDADVDLFLVGHDHTYAWTFPLTGVENGIAEFVEDTDKDYAKGAGLVQVISGVGGRSLRGDTSYNSFPFVAAGYSQFDTTNPPQLSEFGFAQIDVTPSQLTVSYISSVDGRVIDSFTITDADAPPSVTLELAGSPFAEDGGVATVTAFLSKTFEEAVTIGLTFDGVAEFDVDYSVSATSIVIAPGFTSGSITLTGLDDGIDELIESVTIDVEGVTNGFLSEDFEILTAYINDDEGGPLPGIIISDDMLSEGDVLPDLDFPTVATHYDADSRPDWIAAGDLNNDGHIDLVTVNRFGDITGDTVSVLLNNGDGTFAEHVEYLAGNEPTSVVTADLDNDGDLDLAVTIENNVAILLNDGDGTFGLPAPWAAGPDPRSVVAGDLDGDGDVDLAVVNEAFGANSVSILFNTGIATFEPPVTIGVGTEPRYLAVGDLDNDGDLDLAAANGGANDNTVSVLLNDGLGGFAVTAYDASNEPRSVTMADFDNDGFLDLAVANGGFLPNEPAPFQPLDPGFSDRFETITILFNNGDGTFSDPADAFDPSATLVFPTTVDFEDVAVAPGSSVTGGDVFSRGFFFDTLENFSRRANAFNLIAPPVDNGSTYLVVEDAVGFNPVSMFRADGESFALFSLDVAEWASPSRAATRIVVTGFPQEGATVERIIDLDGVFDGPGGAPDIQTEFFDEAWSNLTRVTFKGAGSLTGEDFFAIDKINTQTIDEPRLANPRTTAAGDFDNDGDIDLAVTNAGADDNTISILLNLGDGTFGRPIVRNVDPLSGTLGALFGRIPVSIVAADLDGDSDLDLATANRFGSAGVDGVSVFLNSVNPNFAEFTVTLTQFSDDVVTVDYTTVDGTALGGVDYVTAHGTVSFAPGEFQKTVRVPIIGDLAPELDENFFVVLSNPTNAVLVDDTGEGTIENDDPGTPPAFFASEAAGPAEGVFTAPDPHRPGEIALFIRGTESDDDIFLVQNAAGEINIILDGTSVGYASPTAGIYIDAKGGDDVIELDRSVTFDSIIFGGIGSDLIGGGSGNDLISAGDDDDFVFGGFDGRDVLLGGDGSDLIFGHDPTNIAPVDTDDLLISNITDHDADRSALFAILEEWTSENSFADRIDRLRDGTDGLPVLDGGTISDDGDVDDVFASLTFGDDWLLFGPGDNVQAGMGDVLN